TPMSSWPWPRRAGLPSPRSQIGRPWRWPSCGQTHRNPDRMTFGKYQRDGAYHWDAVSRSLTRHVAFTAGRYQAVLDQPVAWAGSRVLDVACGDAWLSAALAARGARQVVGVDLTLTGLSAGRARWAAEQPATQDRAELVQGDALHLPVASGSFDCVIAS